MNALDGVVAPAAFRQHCIASHRLSHLAELLDLALCELLGAQGDMISVCSEAEVIWCVHQAVTIHNLRT